MSQLVGQHVWANTVVQVYPLASWYTPCWKLNQTCHQEHEDARKAGEPTFGRMYMLVAKAAAGAWLR